MNVNNMAFYLHLLSLHAGQNEALVQPSHHVHMVAKYDDCEKPNRVSINFLRKLGSRRQFSLNERVTMYWSPKGVPSWVYQSEFEVAADDNDPLPKLSRSRLDPDGKATQTGFDVQFLNQNFDPASKSPPNPFKMCPMMMAIGVLQLCMSKPASWLWDAKAKSELAAVETAGVAGGLEDRRPRYQDASPLPRSEDNEPGGADGVILTPESSSPTGSSRTYSELPNAVARSLDRLTIAGPEEDPRPDARFDLAPADSRYSGTNSRSRRSQGTQCTYLPNTQSTDYLLAEQEEYDLNMDPDAYWTWDPRIQKLCHWDEEDQEMVICPDKLD